MVLNAMFFNFVVCFILPIVLAVVIGVGKPKGSTISYTKEKSRGWHVFLLGAAVYSVCEVCIRRLLVDKVFVDAEWYYQITQNDLHYSLFHGVTMSFVEELGRLLIFMFFYKKFTYKHTNKVSAVQYGLGCAWVEAIAVIGYKVLMYFVMTTDDVTILDEIGASRTALAAIERCIFMFYQVGYALLIVNGIRVNRKFIFTASVFVLHAVLASLDIYLGLLGMSYTALLIINGTLAAVVCIFALVLWKKVPVKERKAYENVD